MKHTRNLEASRNGITWWSRVRLYVSKGTPDGHWCCLHLAFFSPLFLTICLFILPLSLYFSCLSLCSYFSSWLPIVMMTFSCQWQLALFNSLWLVKRLLYTILCPLPSHKLFSRIPTRTFTGTYIRLCRYYIVVTFNPHPHYPPPRAPSWILSFPYAITLSASFFCHESSFSSISLMPTVLPIHFRRDFAISSPSTPLSFSLNSLPISTNFQLLCLPQLLLSIHTSKSHSLHPLTLWPVWLCHLAIFCHSVHHHLHIPSLSHLWSRYTTSPLALVPD